MRLTHIHHAGNGTPAVVLLARAAPLCGSTHTQLTISGQKSLAGDHTAEVPEL